MKSDFVTPSIDIPRFNCPHCGAFSNQKWYVVRPEQLQGVPELMNKKRFVDSLRQVDRSVVMKKIGEDDAKFMKMDIARKNSGRVGFFNVNAKPMAMKVENLNLSQCDSCTGIAIWKHQDLVFPVQRLPLEPNGDLNEDIRVDFNEARAILNLSPRGAAALLRLCVQKLCIQLGKPGKYIDKDIKALVEDGLKTEIQQALDIVRVVGNEAVHPGEMNIKDDAETAMTLFKLVNFIADQMISEPKKIKELFGQLPANKLKGIEDRDKKKPPTTTP